MAVSVVSKTKMTVTMVLLLSAISFGVVPQANTAYAEPIVAVQAIEMSEPSKTKELARRKIEERENTVVVSADAKLNIESAAVKVTPAPEPEPEPEPEVVQVATNSDETVEPEEEADAVPVSNDLTPAVPESSSNSSVVAIAMSKVGSAYVYGAGGPSAFDCSGLISWAYAQLGVSLPHQSAAMLSSGTQVATPAPGDIVYTPGHVALYAGDGMVVEAATPATGVVYRPMWQDNPVFIRI